MLENHSQSGAACPRYRARATRGSQTAGDDEEEQVRVDRKILALFMAHRGELVNYANGIVGDRAQAEDVVQEAWLRFGAVAEHRPLEEPVGYLYRIVRNLALDGRRRTSREERVIAIGVDIADRDIAADQPSPEAIAEARDDLRRGGWLLHIAGIIGLGAPFAACVAHAGWSVGPVLWLGLMTVAGLAVALLLAYGPPRAMAGTLLILPPGVIAAFAMALKT